MNPLAGFSGSTHATRNAALTASSSPMRAPELAEMYTQGRPSATARSNAARYTASSFGENEPDMCVMSFATSTISRPSVGYSSVISVARQHTIPTSFMPAGRCVSTSDPDSLSSTSSTRLEMRLLAAPPTVAASASSSASALAKISGKS